MVFDESVHFYGKYRPYQQRVLDNLGTFLENRKVHVVAAPGSGKTILGLELIKRINEVSLILAPSITIREQWISRFTQNFLDDPSKASSYISRNIKDRKPIICITYQAFYSAFKKEENKESLDEMVIEEEKYDDFDLIIALKKYKVKTICLDECHHLKSEWWRVIELVTNQIEDISIIALTATPPYDCSKNDWNRYIRLCGQIDDEIFVPELIHDNNLCPHQDYVYYTYPTKEEEKTIYKAYSSGIKVFSKYRNNKEFLEIVKHKHLNGSVKEIKDNFYENREYYRALVLFFIENKVKVSPFLRLIYSNSRLDIHLFEVLLQNVLFDDAKSYPENKLLTSIKKELASYGIVHNCKVNLSYDDKLDKVMALSLSKIDAIKDIVRNEIDATKGKMKCLILTDYIKMNTKNYIGSNKPIDSFGTLPIFEALRRENIDGVSLCCLSGSICILPVECKSLLEGFEFEDICDGFCEVKISVSNRKELVSSITKLFEENMFNVLIGTKALLGEGWDSPCINTLIMASFIGSYVLSNQMRGRAIRTNPNDKFKKSNIWHLVCLNPYDSHDSTDYYNLSKRFNSFVGIDIERKEVMDGITRTGADMIPSSTDEITELNAKSFENASDRNKVQRVWNYCITNAKSIAYLTKITLIPKKRLKKEISFYMTVLSLVLSALLSNNAYHLYINIRDTGYFGLGGLIISAILAFVSVTLFGYYLARTIFLFNRRNKLKYFGEAILHALQKSELKFSKKIKVKVSVLEKGTRGIYLSDASTFEQNIFSECISQFFGECEDARYLFAKPNGYLSMEYYVVPDVFKKNKESVMVLYKEIRKYFGVFKIAFTRNKKNKMDLIKARSLYSFKFGKCEIETRNVLLQNKKK